MVIMGCDKDSHHAQIFTVKKQSVYQPLLEKHLPLCPLVERAPTSWDLCMIEFFTSSMAHSESRQMKCYIHVRIHKIR